MLVLNALEDQKQKEVIRTQPVKHTRLLQAKYVPWTAVIEGQGPPAHPRGYIT